MEEYLRCGLYHPSMYEKIANLASLKSLHPAAFFTRQLGHARQYMGTSPHVGTPCVCESVRKAVK